jgi:hypothetical protein
MPLVRIDVRKGKGAASARNGTAFFLRTPEALFGVTAAHVVEGPGGWRESCEQHGNAPLRLGAKNGASVELPWDARCVDIDLDIDIATFMISPREIEAIVHHFCATVLPFRSPEDVWTWSDSHGIPMGAVAPIAQVMDLGREWYARHADPDWRKWTVREAAEIFRKVGLVGDFWEIPVTEGGF